MRQSCCPSLFRLSGSSPVSLGVNDENIDENIPLVGQDRNYAAGLITRMLKALEACVWPENESPSDAEQESCCTCIWNLIEEFKKFAKLFWERVGMHWVFAFSFGLIGVVIAVMSKIGDAEIPTGLRIAVGSQVLAVCLSLYNSYYEPIKGVGRWIALHSEFLQKDSIQSICNLISLLPIGAYAIAERFLTMTIIFLFTNQIIGEALYYRNESSQPYSIIGTTQVGIAAYSLVLSLFYRMNRQDPLHALKKFLDKIINALPQSMGGSVTGNCGKIQQWFVSIKRYFENANNTLAFKIIDKLALFATFATITHATADATRLTVFQQPFGITADKSSNMQAQLYEFISSITLSILIMLWSIKNNCVEKPARFIIALLPPLVTIFAGEYMSSESYKQGLVNLENFIIPASVATGFTIALPILTWILFCACSPCRPKTQNQNSLAAYEEESEEHQTSETDDEYKNFFTDTDSGSDIDSDEDTEDDTNEIDDLSVSEAVSEAGTNKL